MNLRLPSGAVVTVTEPRLRALFCGDGSRAAMIDAVWAHGMDAERLSDQDADYLATWCARTVADDPEAEAMATICAVFGSSPAARLGIADRLLAFEVDAALALLLRRRTGGESDTTDTDDTGRVRFSVPGPDGA